MDDFLKPEEAMGVLGECLEAWGAGEFAQAGVGRGEELKIREDVRGDRVCWLEPNSVGAATQAYRDRLEALRLTMNRRLFLGLQGFEGHFAIYPAGAFYKAHLDQHRGTSNRVVTAILYLNPDWELEHGGRLKLWTTPGRADGHHEWIEPRMGTLVVFLSADYWHEVEVAQRQRHSLTGWFRVESPVL